VNGTETHTTLFPHAESPVHWHWRSTTFAAQYYNRTERQIRKWCVNGLFARRGIPVYQDSRGRWWISLNENEAKNLL
jgi:hypothetical protein